MATTKLEMDILSILCEDARISAEKIAAMLNADEEQVRACISKLEDENVIIKYRTLVDWEKVDDDKVEAWIEVRVSPQKNEGFDAIAERITGYPEVRSVYLMSGGYDLMVRIEGNNLKNVAMFVARHLSTIDGVISTATHFLLKSYKRDGVVIVDKKGDKRQAVTL